MDSKFSKTLWNLYSPEFWFTCEIVEYFYIEPQNFGVQNEYSFEFPVVNDEPVPEPIP